MGCDESEPDVCPFEQVWMAGDAYLSEDLEFRVGGTGEWVQYDRRGEQDRESFKWSRKGENLTVTTANDERTMTAQIARNGEDCVLQLGGEPVARSAFDRYFGSIDEARLGE